jgi:SAM-dependent methyltransferase
MGFDAAYRGPGVAPWDIGAPQPEIVGLVEGGQIEGSVIEVGCGTGENALFVASRGHEVLGVDAAPTAIARARAKAAERGLEASFEVRDVLELGDLGRSFDTAIDVGCFHVFDDADRGRYVKSLSGVLREGGRLHLLCFSDAQPGVLGPRRVSEGEIRAAFAEGWEVEGIRPARFATLMGPDGAHAWLAVMRTV